MKGPDIALESERADAELEAATLREPSLFSRFFKRELPRLKNYLSRFVSGDEAEDIAQEAFARVYASEGQVRSPSGLLYHTARNLLIDHSRKRASAGKVMVEGEAVEGVADPHASPEEQTDLRERLERAAAMLDKMTPRCREIFLLQTIEGHTYAEIAAKMSMSVVGVKKQLMRAYEICAAHAEAEQRRSKRGRRRKGGNGA